MATCKLSTWEGWCTSQLNIILLGGRNSGKSSVGNLLLGKEEFVTKERTSCSRRVGMVAGQRVTVVDTPGWWCDFSAQDTCELVKREIVSSVSLCSPGPHVFLITIKVSSTFSERRRQAVEEHVALLGEGVWSYCMVVFTTTDRSKHIEAEEHVRTAGKALHWLSEKCGQRSHSVNLTDDTDVIGLLDKVLKLVRENGNGVFEMQENILQVTAEEKRRVEEKAQQRFMRVKKHRSLMQGRLKPFTDIRIVLVGAKGSGKTSVLNTILGKDNTQPHRRTAQCLVEKGVVFGRDVTAVDTPGWWMNYFCDESTVFDQRELVFSLSLCPPGPHVFLLVIRVDRAFTETYRRAVQEHLQLISDHIWSRVLVLFSVGDWLGGTTTEQYIESEGEPLQWLVERCGNRYHVLNNKTKGDGFQIRELIGKIELMFAEGYQYYEIERSLVEQLEVKRRRENERAKERRLVKENLRQMAKSQLEKLNHLPEMRIVLVGGKKTGKSSCGNTILSGECFNTDIQTASCAEKQGNINGKMVTVLDTPGGFLVTSELMAPLSCAILLVVNTSSSFKNTHREELEKQLEAGGGQLWRRAIVLFSYGDWLSDTNIEQRIESEGEPLQRLVEKCGNRYHVLDNKHMGNGAQVDELIDLMEEMLVEERLAALHQGDHMWGSASAAREEQRDTVTPCEEDLNVSCDLTESDIPTTQATQSCSDATPHPGGQIVALPAGRARGRNILDRHRFMATLASLLAYKNGLRWTAAGQQGLAANIPIYISTDDPHNSLRLNRESQVRLFSPARPTTLVLLPQIQNRLLTEENVPHVHSLCHPALRERTLRRLTECGGLQQLIDQWGDSSLEELEAFIDAYFEMVWDQTMGSFQLTEPHSPVPEQDTVVREAGQEEMLSSIDRKLSKLELLEEIRTDLSTLRESLEHSWTAIQELTHKSTEEPNKSC
ncbi:GTPase IMAP family member 8 [Solea solea]|uniref:GTPase IMAP family member 8 n=1 Tax=Solea solea TaxID=90069 RepID=UPI002729D4C1|nr:GTPase IMAP family member 8 [Solea solea]